MTTLDIGREDAVFDGMGVADFRMLPTPIRPEQLPRPAPKPRRLLTYPQAACELGISSFALGNLVKRGTLTNVGGRGNGDGRIDPDELAALVERRAGRREVADGRR